MSIDATPGVHPAEEAVAAIDAALDSLLGASLWSLPDGQVITLMERQEVLRARLDAAVLATAREFDSRGAAVSLGATSTLAWLRERLHVSAAEAKRRVRLGLALTGDGEPVGAALAAGSISPAHANEIAEAIRRLPDSVDAATRSAAQEFLLEQAGLLDPDQLRTAGARLREVLDPDGIEERERDARAQRSLHFTDRGDGTQRITAILDDLAAATLKAGIDPLAAPRPADDGTADPRTAPQRRADALMDLINQALRHGDLPEARGARPHLVITAGLDTLLNLKGAPPASTASGETVSAELLRKIACDAGVSRILTDPDGLPLDVGRRYRSVPPWMWVALVKRDVGCVFPGCTRPASWAQAHHVRHWADGGETSLDGCALLCDHHHDTVHHKGWDIRLGPDRRPELIPPHWIDPDRKPRINTYWRQPQFRRE